jgi:hypothetical protein
MSNLPFSVTQFSKPLDPSKYTWDVNTKTFSSSEDNLVIDAGGQNHITFHTGDKCNFNTGYHCNFHTGHNCNFNTGSHCNFNTGEWGNFRVGSKCIFKTGEKCVCIRKDIYEIIEIPPNQQIQLNGCNIKGYKIINPSHIISIDGKEIEISEESYQKLKESLNS